MTGNLRSCLTALLLACLTPLFGTHTAVAQPALPDTLALLEELESVYWSADTPPPDAQWEAITLPYNTREKSVIAQSTSQKFPYVWFRFSLDQPDELSNYGLYFWRFNLAIDAYFNGHLIASSPQYEGRETMSWNHPLLASIQTPNWRSEGNEVLLRLTRSPWGGNLAPIVFGEMKYLTPLYEARMLRQVQFNEILLSFGIGLCLISFLLWIIRPRETVYLWFSGMCFSWSVISCHFVVLSNPVPYAIWLPLVHVAIDFSIFFMYGFIGRLITNVKRSNREKLFLVWCLISAASYFYLPPELFFNIAYSIHLIGFLVLAIIVFRVAKLAFQKHNIPAIIVTFSLFIQIALFAHNYYLMFFSSTAQWEGNMFYAHFGVPLLFLVFIGTLLWRFHGALSMVENVNKQLESKVEASRQVIEKSFFERRQLELQQAAEQERFNIYRELHDDVGSKLLSIVHADRDSKLADMARSALESLRHAVSKANNPDQVIHPFVNDIREETELRLLGSGHEIQWTQELPEGTLIVPSKIAFTINRILKEVVSNIIRHANADKVNVQVRCNTAQLEIIVSDNGRGFDRHGPMGNGISNIISRAKEIGALIDWSSKFNHGTEFSLMLPTTLLHKTSLS